MAKTASDTLALVRSQLGNRGKLYWDYMFKGSIAYVSGDVTPYCACGVSWTLGTMGVKAPYFPSTFAFDRRDLPVIGDRWVEKYSLQPGDIVAFDWMKNGKRDGKGDHVGFVEARLTPSTYQTLEYNTNGGIVARRTRSVDDIIGGIRPYYEDEKPAPKPVGKLDVDGVLGPKTKAALQAALQSHGYYKSWDVDGIMGYRTVTELQRYLIGKGFSDHDITGDFGYYSTKDLQRYLRSKGYRDCDVTGTWGRYTTTALQKCLNGGEF